MASLNDELTASQAGLRIVIADDHALVRGGLALLIEMASPGAEVLQANNMTQVTDYLEENKSIDLLMLDLMMPGMQGEIDIKTISQSWPDIPIIIVSVKEDIESIRNSLAAGAMGYIPKNIFTRCHSKCDSTGSCRRSVCAPTCIAAWSQRII